MDNQKLLEVIKELLELMVKELSLVNKRLEDIEREQEQIRKVLELFLEAKEEKASTRNFLTEKISSLFTRTKKEPLPMKEYLSFLIENPEKIPIQGAFKKPTPHKE